MSSLPDRAQRAPPPVTPKRTRLPASHALTPSLSEHRARSKFDTLGTSASSSPNSQLIRGPAGAALRPETLLALQRAHGNAFVQRLLADSSAADHVASPVQRDSRRDPPAKKEPAKDTGGVAIPSARFQGWATKAIEKYEGGATDGLNDFEKNIKEPSSADWQTFALNAVGSVVWALACFATGGTAFFISLAGIAIGAGATAAVMAEPKTSFDLTRFHHHARQAVSGEKGVVEQLNGKVVEASQAMELEAARGKWTDPNLAHRELLERLFAGPQFIREEGGLPTVNRWAVAKKIEAELLLSAAASVPAPARNKRRFPDEGLWLDLDYVAPDAMETPLMTKPFKQWGATLKKATIWDDTGMFPNIAERLNAIYNLTLKGRMPIDQWPLRLEIGINVGADASGPDVPWVYLVLPRRGKGPRRQRGVGLHDVPGRTFLMKGGHGNLAEDVGLQILLDAIPPFNVTSLSQIETGG